MAQYLPLPDGSSLKLREGETPADGWARAQRQYPEAFAAEAGPTKEPESGFIPATKAGVASLKADIAGLLGRTGAIDIPTAEKYRQEQEEYQRRVFKPTEKGWTEAPLTKTAELLGGSLPYMAAPIAAGASVMALPVTGTAATALGIGAAGLASAAQFTGSNISRQVEEGKRLAETELGSAAAAAVPQAALDMVSFRMMPGIRRIFMQAGKEVPEAAAKKIAEQGVKDIAKDYALATGKTMGVEGLTEASQQVFERLQAGLNITDPEARSEYFDSFLGGAILGGAISPAGRFIERGSEQRKQEEEARRLKVEEQRKLQEEKDRQRAAELGAPLLTAEEAGRPLFLDEKGEAKFTDLAERERMLQEKEDAKKEAQESYQQITKNINDLRERAQTASPAEVIKLGAQAKQLETLKQQLEDRAQDKKDPIYKTKLVGFEQLAQEKAEAAPTTYDAIQQKIKRTQGQFDTARDKGDVVAQGRAAQRLQELQDELRGTTPDLFGTENIQRIETEKAAEAKETAVKEGVTKELEKVAEAKPAKDAFYELMSQQTEISRDKERQQEIEQRQGKALERLEFGLKRMGLGVLGVKGEERAKNKVDLEKGVINPVMAEKLGIYTDQLNSLTARLDAAANKEEAAGIKEEIKALKEKAAEPTRAYEVLPQIEAAYEKALAQQRDTVNALSQDRILLFNAQGELTEDGKLAAANEAILQQLSRLRALGRETKETLEAQKAEDLFAAAPTREETRTEQFGQAVEKAAEPVEGISKEQLGEEAKGGAEYSSRNGAFADLSDAAIKLQRGEFLGERPGLVSPETERRRQAELQKKIDKVQDDLTYLRGQQTRAGRQQAPAIQTRIAQLEGEEKKLKAGLSQTKARQLTARKLLLQKLERATSYLINSAVKEVKAFRLAKGYGEMSKDDEIKLRLGLKIEFDRFISRVSEAERQPTAFEEKPVTRVIDGKKVVTREVVPVKPSIERQPYEKIKVALDTVRNALEATVAEAKGLPAKGEIVEEPVEVAKPVKEKPVKTTKKKIAERERAIKHAVKKQAAVEAGKQLVSNNQKQLRELDKELRTKGAEVARLKKASVKDKNPQMRLAKAERIEAEMDALRSKIDDLKKANKAYADALRTLGVATGPAKSGAYLLDMIENDQNVTNDELEEAGAGEQTVARVKELQAKRDVQQEALNAEEAKLKGLKRKLSLNVFFGGPLTTKAQLDRLRNQIEFQERIVGQAKNDVNIAKRALFALLSFNNTDLTKLRQEVAAKQRYIKEDAAKLKELENRAKFYKAVPDDLKNDIEARKEVLAKSKEQLADAEAELKLTIQAIEQEKKTRKEKLEKGTSRFADYELITAARFLQSRIDQIIARTRSTEKAVDETDRKISAQLGLGLPGVRVEFQRGVGYSARADQMVTRERVITEAKPKAQYEAEIAEADANLAEAKAKAQEISDRLRKEGKSVKDDPEWKAAHGKAMKLAKVRKQISDLQTRVIPTIVRTRLFADKDTVTDITEKEATATVEYVEEKEADEADVAAAMVALLKDKVVEAEKALAAVDPSNKTAMTSAKAALTRARNKLANGVAYKARADLTPEEIEETIKEAKENTYTPKKKRKTGEVEILQDIETSLGTYSDADIIDSIDYKSDELDPRVGDAPTELIDEEAANKLLEGVKAKAEAQGLEFQYYRNLSELPIGILKQMAKQGLDTLASGLKGGVHKGKVFVIVQNHNNLVDLQETLAHELIGHYSVDGLLGKEGMIALSKQIDKTPGGLDGLAKKLGLSDVVNGIFEDGVRYYKKAFDDGKITEAQIRANAKIKAMREMIAYTMEKEVTASRMQKLGYWYKALVGAVRAAMRKLGFNVDISTSDLFYIMKQAKQNFEAGKPVAYRDADDTISFRRAPEPPKTGLGTMVAPRDKAFDKVKANLLGLNFRVQFVDRLAALDALVKRGVDAGLISSLKAMDVLYFSRKADQLNNFSAQFLTNGVGKLVKKNGEFQYVGGDGPSMKDVAAALNESNISEKERENAFTEYEIAMRALDVGVDKLDFSKKKVTQADVDATIAKYGKDPGIRKAHELYQQYNRNLIDFLVSTGAMSSEEGARLKKMNYVPYYRKRGGATELVVFGEQPIRIGDMKNQPYLDQLVGGEEEILPVFTGAVQNTQLLVDMALKNMATRNTAFVLGEMGLLDVTEKQAAKGATGIHKGMGPADPNVIRFKIDGTDMWARVNVEAKQDIFGDIPTELVVTGMEGIKATLPMGIRLLGMPANLLRKLVTRDPRYAVRQIFRDSMSAVMTTGANFVPVVQTVKDMATMKKGETYRSLQGSGSLGGQVISGATDDMDKVLQQITAGKPGWTMAMAKLDEWAMMGDAATRVSMYNSFIKQGLSEREADFATMEAMNFSRRGLSPTVLYANTLIPFFNAGVQGLDVLYRAFRKDMPFSERLKVRQKLIARGITMGVLTMLYAAAMDDDETYKNANPDERYNNWFVPTPLGTLRVPIPFEVGFIFKSLFEGVYRSAFTDDKNSEILSALKDQAMRSVPLDMPTAIKPVVELMLNRSFFTGREIVDGSMSEVAKYQYRPNTTELAKMFGEFGISPAKVEYFVKGYTGTLPIGLISLIENVSGIKSVEKEPVAMRIYEAPIIGGLFQPPDANGMINRAYETVKRAQGAKSTYDRLLKEDPKEAAEFLKANLNDIQVGQPAGMFRQQMGEITQYERFIRESRTLTADEKRARLDKTKQMKIKMSQQFNRLTAQT